MTTSKHVLCYLIANWKLFKAECKKGSTEVIVSSAT